MTDTTKPNEPRRTTISRGPTKIIPIEGSERARALAQSRARAEAEEQAAKANRERIAAGITPAGSRGRPAVTTWPWAKK